MLSLCYHRRRGDTVTAYQLFHGDGGMGRAMEWTCGRKIIGEERVWVSVRPPVETKQAQSKDLSAEMCSARGS